jgi:hypothetical protein
LCRFGVMSLCRFGMMLLRRFAALLLEVGTASYDQVIM